MESSQRLRLRGIQSGGDDEWRATALRFRAERQSLLASNIANADTPGYAARDASFSSALEKAQDSAIRPQMSTTSGRHIGLAPSATISTLELAWMSTSVQPSADQNTVNPDRERSEFAKNVVLYQLALESLGDELKEFKLASSDPLK